LSWVVKFGGIFTNNSGNFLGGFYESLENANAFQDETSGVIHAIYFVSRKDGQIFSFECDFSLTIQHFSNPS
jgi:hypothetical protein